MKRLLVAASLLCLLAGKGGDAFVGLPVPPDRRRHEHLRMGEGEDGNRIGRAWSNVAKRVKQNGAVRKVADVMQNRIRGGKLTPPPADPFEDMDLLNDAVPAYPTPPPPPRKPSPVGVSKTAAVPPGVTKLTKVPPPATSPLPPRPQQRPQQLQQQQAPPPPQPQQTGLKSVLELITKPFEALSANLLTQATKVQEEVVQLEQITSKRVQEAETKAQTGISQAQAEINATTATAKALQARINELQSAKDSSTASAAAAQDRVTSIEEALRQLKSKTEPEIAQLQAALKVAEGKVAEFSQKVARADALVAEATKKADAERERRERAEALESNRREAAAKAESELMEEKRRRTQAEALEVEARSALVIAGNKLQEVMSREESAISQLASEKSAREAVIATSKELSEEVTLLRRAVEDGKYAVENASVVSKELELAQQSVVLAMEQLEQEKLKRERITAEAADTVAGLERLTEKNRARNEETIWNMKQELERLKTEVDRTEGYDAAVEAVAAAKRREKFKEEDARVLRRNLAGAQQQVKEALRRVEQRRTANEDLKEALSEASFQLAASKIKADLADTLKLELAEEKSRAMAVTAALLEAQKEIGQIAAELVDASTKQERTLNALFDMERSYESATGELKTLRNENRSLQELLERSRKRYSSVISRQKLEMAELKAEVRGLMDEAAEGRAKAVETAEALERLAAAEAQKKKAEEEARQARAEMAKANEEKNRALQALRLTRDQTAEERAEKLERALFTEREALASTAKALASTKASLHEIQKEKDRLDAAYMGDLEALRGEKEEAQKKVLELRTALDGESERVKQLERKVEDQAKKIESANTELANAISIRENTKNISIEKSENTLKNDNIIQKAVESLPVDAWVPENDEEEGELSLENSLEERSKKILEKDPILSMLLERMRDRVAQFDEEK